MGGTFFCLYWHFCEPVQIALVIALGPSKHYKNVACCFIQEALLQMYPKAELVLTSYFSRNPESLL
jgi:hypothetical protein